MNTNADRTTPTQGPAAHATTRDVGDSSGEEQTAATDPCSQNRHSPWCRLRLIFHPSWTRRTAPWRQAVQRRRVMLHNDLLRLDLTGEQDLERSKLINGALADADNASRQLTTVARWWWGTEIERAWARLREVEERSIDLLPDDEIRVHAAAVLSDPGSGLGIDDRRRRQLDKYLEQSEGGAPVNPEQLAAVRAAIVEALRHSHRRSTKLAQEARFLRNRILLGSVITVIFAGLVLASQAHLSQVEVLERPAGATNSAWQFLALVMLFGCVGSLFTAIPAMAAVPPDFSPFNLPLQQAILKIVYGAIAAFVGMLIVSTNMVESDLVESMSGVVVLSIVFGAGQQFVTGFVDRKAKEILGSAASDDVQATSAAGANR